MLAINKMFIAKKIFITNELDGIQNSDKLIKKFVKPKIGKLFKFQKSKSKRLVKF